MTPEDHIAIEQLVRKFAVLNDAGDYEGVAALFVEDGSFARPSAPDKPTVGRDNILAAFKGRPPRQARHLLCNTVITPVDADTAQVHSYSVLIVQSGAGGSLSVGAFDDVVVRQDGGWFFQSRVGSTALDGLPLAAPQ